MAANEGDLILRLIADADDFFATLRRAKAAKDELAKPVRATRQPAALRAAEQEAKRAADAEARVFAEAMKREERSRREASAVARQLYRDQEREAKRSAEAEFRAVADALRREEAQRREAARIAAALRRDEEQSAKRGAAVAAQAARDQARAEALAHRDVERASRERASAIAAHNSTISKSFGALRGLISSTGQALVSFGRTLSVAVTLPIVALGGFIVGAATKMESLKLGLRAVAGSAEEADKQLVRLQEIAKLPGIGFAEAIQGSIRLQAVGFSARDAERSLKAFANAIALTGGGKAELQAVTVQLAQLSGKSKILAQDLRPIIEASPAVAAALKKAFGTVDSEEISKKVSGPGEFLRKLIPELEALPHVAGGAKTAFENLQDSLFRLGATIGTTVLPPLVALADKLIPLVEQAAAKFAALSPEMQQVIIGGLALAAVLGPMLIVIGSLVTGIAGFIASLIAAKGAFVAIAFVGAGLIQFLELLAVVFAPVIVAVGLFVAAVFLARDKLAGAWAAILETFHRAVEAVKAFATGDWARGAQLVVEVFGRALGILSRVVGEAIQAANEKALSLLADFGDTLKTTGRLLGLVLSGSFGAALSQLPVEMQKGIAAVVAVLLNAPNILTAAAIAAGKAVVKGFREGAELASGTFSGARGGIGAGGAFAGVTGAITDRALPFNFSGEGGAGDKAKKVKDPLAEAKQLLAQMTGEANNLERALGLTSDAAKATAGGFSSMLDFARSVGDEAIKQATIEAEQLDRVAKINALTNVTATLKAELLAKSKAIEVAEQTALANERQLGAEALENLIARARIAAIVDDREREAATINQDLAQERLRLAKQYGEVEATIRINDLRKLAILKQTNEELARQKEAALEFKKTTAETAQRILDFWHDINRAADIDREALIFTDRERRNAEDIRNALELAGEIIRETGARTAAEFDSALRKANELVRLRREASIATDIRGALGNANPSAQFDSGALAKINDVAREGAAILAKYGLVWADVQTVMGDVALTSENVREAIERLHDAMVNQGPPKVLQRSFKDIAKDVLFSEQALASFAESIGRALASAITDGENFARAMGALILSLIGDLCIAWGQYHLALGIANSLNPLTPGSGAGEIAGGLALIALGGLLKGLAGALGSTQASESVATGGGGGASSGGGGGVTPSQRRVERIQFNTSGERTNEHTFRFVSDGSNRGNFLKAVWDEAANEGFIRVGDLDGGSKRRLVKRKLR